jgi:FkbM family methyltransferase
VNAGVLRSLVVYWGQPWKWRRMDALYRHFVQPGDLCFDVGAHVGNRIRSFLALGARRVVAVEPQPAMLSVLRTLYGRRQDVLIAPIGLADKPGKLTLNISLRTPTVSTFDSSWIEELGQDRRWDGIVWDGRQEIEVRTLDQLIEEHGEPAFCKIDVEGFEESVLLGLSRPLRSLSFEYLPAARQRALRCVDRLTGLGDYEFWTSPGESHTFAQRSPWKPHELRAFLESLSPGEPSGDVYARRL